MIFTSPFHRWRHAFLFVCVLAASMYVYSAGKVFVASRLSQSLKLADLQRAVRLEPSNAQYRAVLANEQMMIESDTVSGIEQLRFATDLNPYASAYWMSLARAYLVSGDTSAEQAAIEHALKVDPTTPDVAWQAAAFYVVHDDPENAYACLHTVIEGSPELADSAIQMAWRLRPDPGKLLDEVLPPRATRYGLLLRRAVQAGDAQGADLVWDRTYALKQAIRPDSAFSYFEELIAARRIHRAQEVWRQVIESDSNLRRYATPDNFVVNGGFEEPLLNGGFDWHIQAAPNVEIDLDTLSFHGGRQSLSLNFDTATAADLGLKQYIPVEPNKRYVLRGFVKSEELETASGPRFAIEDAYTKRLLGISEETVGSAPWQERSVEFTAPSETSLVVLRLVRDPGNKLIRGKFWIDDVSVQKEQD